MRARGAAGVGARGAARPSERERRVPTRPTRPTRQPARARPAPHRPPPPPHRYATAPPAQRRDARLFFSRHRPGDAPDFFRDIFSSLSLRRDPFAFITVLSLIYHHGGSEIFLGWNRLTNSYLQLALIYRNYKPDNDESKI